MVISKVRNAIKYSMSRFIITSSDLAFPYSPDHSDLPKTFSVSTSRPFSSNMSLLFHLNLDPIFSTCLQSSPVYLKMFCHVLIMRRLSFVIQSMIACPILFLLLIRLVFLQRFRMLIWLVVWRQFLFQASCLFLLRQHLQLVVMLQTLYLASHLSKICRVKNIFTVVRKSVYILFAYCKTTIQLLFT